MKPVEFIRTMAVTAALLAAANFIIRWPVSQPAGDIREAVKPGITNDSKAIEARRAASFPKKAEAVARLSFKWAPVESTDYKKYMANLRGLGFPDELIREIIMADINKLYEFREQPLKLPFVPLDAPASQRQHLASDQELEQARQLRALQIEKQDVLKQLLGVDIPRPLIRTPTARNYEAYEYALSLLPADKRDAAELIVENEFLEDDVNKRLPRHEYVQLYQQRREQRNTELNQALNPDEFRLFEINSTPAATELTRRTIGMEPTETEARAMLELAGKQWADTGGVYGLWRANPVSSEQIATANQEFDNGLRQALGQERYVDYQMATTDTGQQMNNLGNRYNLSRETLRAAFGVQAELDNLNKVAVKFETDSLQQSRAELEQRLQQMLSPDVWDAWVRGRNQRYELQP